MHRPDACSVVRCGWGGLRVGGWLVGGVGESVSRAEAHGAAVARHSLRGEETVKFSDETDARLNAIRAELIPLLPEDDAMQAMILRLMERCTLEGVRGMLAAMIDEVDETLESLNEDEEPCDG